MLVLGSLAGQPLVGGTKKFTKKVLRSKIDVETNFLESPRDGANTFYIATLVEIGRLDLEN